MAALSQSQLHPLHRSTGSVHYSSPNLDQEILCAVNAPVDVQRRDELPNETYVDVHVRPNNGVGMIRERHLETLIQRVVKEVILGRLWPRTAVQITLQILKDGSTILPEFSMSTYLTILPSLLNATCLALIDAGVPMRCPFASTIAQIDNDGNITTEPMSKSLEDARSLHALAFSSKGDLLLIESEGVFSISEFIALTETAKDACVCTKIEAAVNAEVTLNNRWRGG